MLRPAAELSSKFRSSQKFLFVCLSALFLETDDLRAKISCDLFGLTIDEQNHPFGKPIEIVADYTEEKNFRDSSLGIDSVPMRACEIGGVSVGGDKPIYVQVFGESTNILEVGHRYRMKGEIRDGVGFGGKISLSYFLVATEPLGKSPKNSSLEVTKQIELRKQIGKNIEFIGTIWSLNGVWWLSFGKEKVYLTDAAGRSKTFEVNWHGRQVRVKGLVKRQLRPSLDQISQKAARDLVMYPVIVNTQVSLDSKGNISDEKYRFRPLYRRTPKMVNGAFELLPESRFNRNVVGGKTRTSSYVERNWPQIEHTLKHATDASKESIAKRIKEPKVDTHLRLIYAGILVSLGDHRGREYLQDVAKLNQLGELATDLMYLLGAIDSWTKPGEAKVEENDAWLEELALHFLQNTPGRVVAYSSIPEMLIERKSKSAIDQMINLMLKKDEMSVETESGQDSTPEKGTGLVDTGGLSRRLGLLNLNPNDMSPADYADSILIPILSAGPNLVSTAKLIELCESYPKPDYNRRLLFREFLLRDDPRTLSLFLDDLKTSFWPMEIRENTGPNVIASVREVLPKLGKGEIRSELESLLIIRSANAAETLATMIEDPQTPIDELRSLSWELSGVKNGDLHVASIARVLQKRVLKQAPENPSALDVVRMIKWIGQSSDKAAIEAMIDLMSADFSLLADDWVSEKEFRHHIAGQLAEMTGESFGDDPDSWKKWSTLKR